MSAHYNGYFNAREILNEAITKMDMEYVDDYQRVLPMFTYGSPKDAKTAAPAMEKVFTKCSEVIERHSMMIKGVEYCKWIDETYILIGRSHFYRHDYFAGIESFEYTVGEFKKQPTKFEALLWMIRTYNEIGAFTRSQGYIDLCKSDKTFPYALNGQLAAVMADFYLKQDNYPMAEKELNKAIAYEKNKKVKARYTFILAQILQKMKANDRARNAFGQVVKLNPKYELTFYAKINQAKLYDASSASSRSIKSQLTKMLSDIKNVDYNDQIYYALAEISEKEGNNKETISLLQKSMRASTVNTNQKGISALKLADIYFAQPEYTLAEAYYDSAVTSLSKDFPDYEAIANKRNYLGKLVANYRLIAKQDSLQRVSSLSESERNKLIDQLIEKEKEAEAKRKEEEELRALQNSSNNLPGQQTANQNQGSGSSWYFYNPQTLSFGFSEFSKKWGNRKLEDNWRRSNKQSVAPTGEEEGEVVAGKGTATDSSNNKYNRAYYAKELLLTPALMDSSKAKVIEAYYDLSLIYKEQLANNEKSAESLEALLAKYPKNKYQLPSYYQLYRLYTLMRMDPQAEKYKNILLTQFPESDYALILKNPEFNNELKKKLDKVENYYEVTYLLYQNGDYAGSFQRCVAADSMDLKVPMKAKFAFLKALSIGHIADKKEFEAALRSVVVNFPKEEVKPRAQDILNLLAGGSTLDSLAQNNDSTKQKNNVFVFNPAKEHFFVMVIDPLIANAQTISAATSDFNLEYFGTKNLNTVLVPFGKSKQLLTVKSFENATIGMDYFITFRDNGEVMKDYPPGALPFFSILKENYLLLMKSEKAEEYANFFAKNYSNFEGAAKNE